MIAGSIKKSLKDLKKGSGLRSGGGRPKPAGNDICTILVCKFEENMKKLL